MIRHVSFIAAIVLLVLLAAPLATLAQQDIRGDDDCLVITPRNRHECCEQTAMTVYWAVFYECKYERDLPDIFDVCNHQGFDASRQAYSDCYFGSQRIAGLPGFFRLFATDSAASSIRFRAGERRPARLAVYRGQVREGTLVLNGVPVADLAADFPDGAARTVVPVVLDAGWNTLELLGTGTNSGSILVIPLDQE